MDRVKDILKRSGLAELTTVELDPTGKTVVIFPTTSSFAAGLSVMGRVDRAMEAAGEPYHPRVSGYTLASRWTV